MPDKELEPVRSSLIQVRVGNRTYDAVRVNTCHTCMHPARMEIEEAVVNNHSYRSIADRYSEVSYENSDGTTTVLPKIGFMSIRNHFKRGHMPIGQAALRRIGERRAQEIGSKYEEMSDQFVDHYTVAQAVLRKGYERLNTGDLEPDVKETLAAAKLLKEIEDGAQQTLDADAWSQAMTVYFETARQFMDDGTWTQFTQSLATNPILHALSRRVASDGSNDDVVDAEYEETP